MAAKKKPYLTKDEERALIRKAQHGDIAARNTLIEKNADFIWWRCIHFAQRGKKYKSEDLLGEAVLGYIKAIDKFDLKRGGRLSTYGAWWIFQALSEFNRRNRSIVCVPGSVTHPNKDRAPSAEVMSAARTALMPTFSLSRNTDSGREGGFHLSGGEQIELPAAREDDPQEERLPCTIEVIEAAQVLPARLATLVRMRCEGATLQEIGDEIGVTKERVRQMEPTAFREIRILLDPDYAHQAKFNRTRCGCWNRKLVVDAESPAGPRKRCMGCGRSWSDLPIAAAG